MSEISEDIRMSDNDNHPENSGRHHNNNNNGGENPNASTRNRTKSKQEKDKRNKSIGDSLTLQDENLLLRRHLRKQEEKIKLLATKLVRIVGDRKSKEKRDEILIEEQKTRIVELEQQVSTLRDKLRVSREQLSSCTKLIPTLHPATSSSKHSLPISLTKSPKPSKKHAPSSARPSTGRSQSQPLMLDHEFTSKVEQLLLEAKAENQALEDQLRVTRERLVQTESELERSDQRFMEMEMNHREDLLKARGQFEGEHDRSKKKKTLQDNIQLIRLQRESRRTSSWLSTMEAQCRALESSLASANETIAQLESQIVSLQDELRDGQQKQLTLQKQLEDRGNEMNRLKELEAALQAGQEENKILRQTNESLVDKTFSSANLRRGTPSTEQLSQLEATLKSEINQKAELAGGLAREKAKSKMLEDSVASLQKDVEEQKRKVKELERELEHLKKMGRTGGDDDNIAESAAGTSKSLSEIMRQREEWENELSQTQWQLVQVRDELDKTRALLRTQMNINKECQKEVETLTSKLDKTETFHTQKLQEFMELLEQRTRQMTVLESTLETIKKPIPKERGQKSSKEKEGRQEDQ